LFGCGTVGPDLVHIDGKRIDRRVNSEIRGIDYGQVQVIRLTTQISCPRVHLRVRKLGLPARTDESRMTGCGSALQQNNLHTGSVDHLNSAAYE